MNTLFYYLKYLGIFLLFILLLGIVSSLFSLFGLTFISKLIFIFMALGFFFISAHASHKSKEKGYKVGFQLSIVFILFLLLINLIFFSSKISMSRFIYYIILLASGILGGSFGKNLKTKKLAR